MQKAKSFFELYMNEVKQRFQDMNIAINEDKLEEYCLSKLEDKTIVFHNNDANTDYEITTSKLLRMIFIGKGVIVTPHNTLFRTSEKVNGVVKDIQIELIQLRKHFKNLMKEFLGKDQLQYELNDMLQKVIKVIANSFYGAMGEGSFHFYDEHLGPSITACGRNLISNAITSFEAYLGGNIFFDNIEELSLYLSNISKGVYLEDNEVTMFEGLDITKEKVIEEIYSLYRGNDNPKRVKWLIKQYIHGFEDNSNALAKFYFKNKLFEFMNLPFIKELFKDSFDVDNFPDVNKPPVELQETLDILVTLLEEYVMYYHPISNKVEKAKVMKRDNSVLTDTDSTFLTMLKWLLYVCELSGKDRKDLTTEERVSKVTIGTYHATKFIDKCLHKTTENQNVLEADRPNINMKSEFHFSRILLTKNKKNYAGLKITREGIILPLPELDLKGLPIRKISAPKPCRIFFGELLENDILNSKEIDSIAIYRKFCEYEKFISESIKSGDTSFFKNTSVKALNFYKNPFSMQQVRGFVLWNELYPNETIPASSSVKVVPLLSTSKAVFADILKDNPNKDHILECMDKVSLLKVGDLLPDSEMKDESYLGKSRYYADVLSIPFNLKETPKDFADLIDVSSITNSALANGNILLESLGFRLITSNKYRVVSNIVEL